MFHITSVRRLGLLPRFISCHSRLSVPQSSSFAFSRRPRKRQPKYFLPSSLLAADILVNLYYWISILTSVYIAVEFVNSAIPSHLHFLQAVLVKKTHPKRQRILAKRAKNSPFSGASHV